MRTVRAGKSPALVVTTGFDTYQQQLVRGVLTVLHSRGPVLVANSNPGASRGLPTSVVQLIRNLSPYGAIAMSCSTERAEAELATVLSDLGLPAIRVGVQTPGMSCVHADDLTAMRTLMSHLLDDLGVRRPVFVRGIRHQMDAVRREQAFREALTIRGIPVDEELVIDGNFYHQTAYRELRALLRRRRDLDAVVAANDCSALGVLKALADEGLSVPEDVVVTGFDNDPNGLSWPELTTVDPDLHAQGAAAATRLLAEIDGLAPGGEVSVPARVLIRGSTRAPKGAGQVAAVAQVTRTAQDRLTTRDAMWALSYALHTCTTPQEVAATLADTHLEMLGIDRCFLATRVDDATSEHHGSTPVNRVRLILDYRDGRGHRVPPDVYPLDRLLPDSLRSELDSNTLVFEPMVAGDRELGYLLLEPGRDLGLVTDWLRNNLSRTLEVVFSTQALKDHAKGLERMVDQRTAQLAARTEQLESEVETRRLAEERLRQAVVELHRLAMNDGLTNLANRVSLQQYLDTNWRVLAARGDSVAIVLIDVDLFKAYNDSYGHRMGDETLQTVASCLAGAVRHPHDLACRYGGEEFVVVLPGGDLSVARSVAERFRSALAAAAIPHVASTVSPVVTVSIGIAVGWADGDTDPWKLLEHADRALYRAKAAGRDQVCVFQSAAEPPAPVRTPAAAGGASPGVDHDPVVWS